MGRGEMRVVLVRPASGGVAHVGKNVASALIDTGHSVVEIPVADTGLPAWATLRDALSLRRALRTADVVHLEVGSLNNGVFWFGLWASMTGAPVTATAHDVPVIVRHPGAALAPRAPGWRDAFAYNIVARATDHALRTLFARRVGAWGALSRRAAKDLAAAIGSRGTVQLVRHGADEPMARDEAIAAKTVAFAGTIGPGKGLDVLLAAWQMITHKNDFRLHVLGKGQFSSWYEQLRTLAELDPTIQWVEEASDDEFRRFIADASVIVLPYRVANPASGVLIHAVAEHKPVIASDIEPFKSSLGHEVDALLVTPDDAVELSEALRRVTLDPDLLDGLTAGAQARRRQPTWSDQASDLVELFGSVSSSPSNDRDTPRGTEKPHRPR